MAYMRIWKEMDITEVIGHIVIVDDQLGFCPNCRKIGIPLKDLEKCPSCDNEFHFVTSAEAKHGKKDIVMRTLKKLPHLTFVDYDDYEYATGKDKADNLFSI